MVPRGTGKFLGYPDPELKEKCDQDELRKLHAENEARAKRASAALSDELQKLRAENKAHRAEREARAKSDSAALSDELRGLRELVLSVLPTK